MLGITIQLARAAVAAAAAALVLAACATGASPSASDAPVSVEPSAESMAPASEEPSDEATPMASEEPSIAPVDGSIVVAQSDLGPILTDREGMTIYYFANDSEGVSNCSGDCLANWPAVTLQDEATAGEGVEAELGAITRDDGDIQLTVNGFPAYYFAGDQAAGDTNGQGVGGVWWVFAPDGEPIEN